MPKTYESPLDPPLIRERGGNLKCQSLKQCNFGMMFMFVGLAIAP